MVSSIKQRFIGHIPKGWGYLLDRLANEVVESFDDDFISKIYIADVKEKYGSLMVYVFVGDLEDEYDYRTDMLNTIIAKYESESQHTCAVCGNRATEYSKGYLLPLCNECSERLSKKGCKHEHGK